MRIWDCPCHCRGGETGDEVLRQMDKAGVDRINLFAEYPGQRGAPGKSTQADIRATIDHIASRFRRVENATAIIWTMLLTGALKAIMRRTCRCPVSMSLLALTLCVTGTVTGAAEQETVRNVFTRRYVMVRMNVGQEADRAKVLGIMRRAAAAGYNGILLGSRAAEYLGLWRDSPSESYARAFAVVRKEADALHLALIPYAINPNEVGYAAPELSEAIPCRDTPFLVRGGTAEVAAEPAQLLTNPGFEEFKENSPDGWSHDKPGVVTLKDTQVKHGGNASARIQDPGPGNPPYGHGRIWQTLAVTPFRAYEFSVWAKTDNLTNTGNCQIAVYGSDGQQPQLYSNRDDGMGAPIRSTQDWTRYTIRFNSASNTRLTVYFGIWSNKATGKLWFDDAEMHEIGLVHTVRRDSLPVKVTSADGAQTYKEGKDYAVGEGKLTIPAGSRIADGARLKVSWYQRAEMIGPPFASAAQPRYFEVEEGIARKLDELFGHPHGFAMTYDEWRVANWDPAAGNITAGEYMANTVRKTIDFLKRINPRYELYVWSDMWDPNTNALEKYFMCNGSLTGSWKGLSKDTILLTWDGGEKSLRFFSDLGMRQIVSGYYESLDNVKQWLDQVDAVEAQGATGIDGFMYTTWDDNFGDLEKAAEMIRARGRWGQGPAFQAAP